MINYAHSDAGQVLLAWQVYGAPNGQDDPDPVTGAVHLYKILDDPCTPIEVDGVNTINPADYSEITDLLA